MRILILGTSNSLLRGGWVQGLKDAMPGSSIDNRSVGASPGIQFAAMMGEDFTQYDLVLFDSIPNDEGYEEKSSNEALEAYSQGEFVDKILYQIASTIMCQTNFAFIGISSRAYCNGNSSAFHRRRELARKLGCQFVNFSELVSRYMVKRKLDRSQIYDSHPSHPRLFLAYKIGSLLGSILCEGIVAPVAKKRTDFRGKFRVYAEEERFFQRTYRNSLLEATAAIIEAGSEIVFDEKFLLIGFYINSKDTHCAIQIDGERQVRGSLFYETEDAKIQKIFVPIPNGIRARKISIKERSEDYNLNALMSVPRDNKVKDCRLSLLNWVWWDFQEADPQIEEEVVSSYDTNKITEALSEPWEHWIDSGDDRQHLFASLPSHLAALSQGNQKRLVLTSYHNTIVCFDLTTGTLRHVPSSVVSQSCTLLPITMMLSGTQVDFRTSFLGLEILLGLDSRTRQIGFSLGASSAAKFDVEFEPNGMMLLSLQGANLFAEFSGGIMWSPVAKHPYCRFHFTAIE